MLLNIFIVTCCVNCAVTAYEFTNYGEGSKIIAFREGDAAARMYDIDTKELYASGGGDLTPDHLTPEIIAAIAVTGVIVVLVLILATSCIYYKIKRSNGNGGFARVNDATESSLHMIDYDELETQHGSLSFQLPGNNNQNTNESIS